METKQLNLEPVSCCDSIISSAIFIQFDLIILVNINLSTQGNFNTVIAMYARSPIFDAPERAEKVLRRFRDLCGQNALGNKPDEYSYSLLLKAWYVELKSARLHGMISRKLTMIASSYI